MRILSGIYKNRILKAPKGEKTRPTLAKVRGSVFDILQNQIHNTSFLDLFAGSGSIGIEALSRGAKSATFVEKDRAAASCIRDNLKALQIDARLFQTDAASSIKRLIKEGLIFDIIYIDPPYALEITPILEKASELLSEGGMIILEQGKNTKIETPLLKKTDERSFGDTLLFFFVKS